MVWLVGGMLQSTCMSDTHERSSYTIRSYHLASDKGYQQIKQLNDVTCCA